MIFNPLNVSLAFLRNIFQDVMHKDTLVKSFIDEVSLHYSS